MAIRADNVALGNFVQDGLPVPLRLSCLIDVPLPIGFVVLPLVLGSAVATEVVEWQPPFSTPVELRNGLSRSQRPHRLSLWLLHGGTNTCSHPPPAEARVNSRVPGRGAAW